LVWRGVASAVRTDDCYFSCLSCIVRGDVNYYIGPQEKLDLCWYSIASSLRHEVGHDNYKDRRDTLHARSFNAMESKIPKSRTMFPGHGCREPLFSVTYYEVDQEVDFTYVSSGNQKYRNAYTVC